MLESCGSALDANEGGVGIDFDPGPIRTVERNMRCASEFLQVGRGFGRRHRLHWPQPVAGLPWPTVQIPAVRARAAASQQLGGTIDHTEE